MKFKIPQQFNVGGQSIAVSETAQMDDNTLLGECSIVQGYLLIARTSRGKDVTAECRLNTFFHELTHLILDTMGEDELSGNEKFVNTFSSFLTEAIVSSKIETEDESRGHQR